MSKIRAVLVEPGVRSSLALREVERQPVTASAEVLVRVAAISPNRGEIRRIQSAEPGWRPGWALAGKVESTAQDGSGPQVGTRVVGYVSSGAWAEMVVVPSDSLAELPEGVSFAQAATLPVAGFTALAAVEKYPGGLLGRNVLVTGASGGVGNFAVQLARSAGARIVGLIRQPKGESMVREAGAQEVVVDDEGRGTEEFGPYDLVVDSVGGVVLGNVLSMLKADGVCVNFGGASSSREVTFDLWDFYRVGWTSLKSLAIFRELERDPAGPRLAGLVRLVAQGELRPHFGVDASWEEIGDIVRQLDDRSYAGKAVLRVTGDE